MGLFERLIRASIERIPAPIVGKFARPYVAGAHLEDAVRVTRELNRQGMTATLDVLGEEVDSPHAANRFKDACLSVLAAIERENLDATISLKPTQLGLLLGKEMAAQNIGEVVAEAAGLENFVRIDMEDRRCTDASIELYDRLRKKHPGSVGLVLQARLMRTPRDIASLADGPLNIRLCKGIYDEPREVAWTQPDVINRSFTWCLEELFEREAFVGIATHDTRLVFEAGRLIRRHGLRREQYEFQMLLGVDPQLREILLGQGHRLRIYVPFGEDWLPYCRRRLKENPQIARHVLRQLIRRRQRR